MHGSHVNHANAQLHAPACSHVLDDDSFHQVTCNPIDDRIARTDLVDGTRAYRPRTLSSKATPVLIIPEQVMHLDRMRCLWQPAPNTPERGARTWTPKALKMRDYSAAAAA